MKQKTIKEETIEPEEDKQEEAPEVIEEEIDMNKFLEDEIAKTQQESQFESHPAIKFEENKTKKLRIPFPTQRWHEYVQVDGTITKKKAIIPCFSLNKETGNEEEYVWWLNKRNPMYTQLLEKLKLAKAQIDVKVLQTGSQENTKYVFIEDGD